jgi:hypothetical protein
MKDAVLDSGISRRIASERPLGKLKAMPGVATPVPTLNDIDAASPPDPTATTRVAAAKASIQAQRDSSGAPADRARVQLRGAQSVAAERVNSAANAAEAAGAQALERRFAGDVAGFAISQSPAGQCYRIESSTPQAQWASVPLPFLIAFDTAGTSARILTPTGGETDARATWAKTGPDSLVLRLRRIGYSGSLELSAIGDAKTGVMRSSQLNVQLSDVGTTGIG